MDVSSDLIKNLAELTKSINGLVNTPKGFDWNLLISFLSPLFAGTFLLIQVRLMNNFTKKIENKKLSADIEKEIAIKNHYIAVERILKFYYEFTDCYWKCFSADNKESVDDCRKDLYKLKESIWTLIIYDDKNLFSEALNTWVNVLNYIDYKDSSDPAWKKESQNNHKLATDHFYKFQVEVRRFCYKGETDSINKMQEKMIENESVINKMIKK